MSIQTNKYTSKKTGKVKTQYYASVWYSVDGRSITGPMRDTKKAAEQDQTDIQREIEAGKAKASKKKRDTTVDQVYDQWHDATKPPTYANNTWQVYGQFYGDYIQDVFGMQAVSIVKPTHIQKYVNLLKSKYSPEVVNKCITVLKNIFAFAEDVLKCITSNPVDGIKRCKVPRKKKITWDDNMITYFLSLPEVRKSHYYPMLCLSAALGPRPGEVCGLKENSLISKHPKYYINMDYGFDNWECDTDMKTSGSHRTPPIPPELYNTIHSRLVWKKKTRLETQGWGANNYLFVSQNGNPIKPRQYATAFKRLLQAHNRIIDECADKPDRLLANSQKLPYITLYGFRTSFATNNMRKWPDPALISSIMGNTPKTLLQFYSQSDDESQEELICGYLGSIKTVS